MSALSGKVRWIARAWRRQLGLLPVLLGLTAISTAVTLVYPLAFGWVLDEVRRLSGVAVGGDELAARLNGLMAVLAAVGLGRLLAATYPAFRALVNSRIEVATRADAFAHVLRKGHRFFTHFRTGDIVTRLTDDISGYPKIAWFCCSGLFRALDSLSRVVFCLIAMLALDWRLALASLVPVPLMIGLFVLLQRSLQRAAEAQRAAASETSDFLEASFSGVTVLQAYGAERRLGDALAAQLERRARAELRLARLWVLFSIFFQALNVIGQLVVVVVGGLRVIEGTLSLGDFFSFYLFLGLLLPPMMDLPNLFVTARQAFVCIDRLEELRAFDPEGETRAVGRGAAWTAFDRLEVEGLAFRYPERPAAADVTPSAASSATPSETGAQASEPSALRDVSLELERGERVAVVGEVGAGKTTLLRLLAGVLRPDRGAIRYGERALEDYDGPALRRALGYVPQDPVLFQATVRENVLLGRPEDPERLARALSLAGMSEEVAALPDGLDHALGLRGRGLSGGQRQRLTIARALYGDPELLLLDDITAALDAENEERFWERVAATWPDATVLVVTHRAATARRMQRVLELRDGALRAQTRPARAGVG